MKSGLFREPLGALSLRLMDVFARQSKTWIARHLRFRTPPSHSDNDRSASGVDLAATTFRFQVAWPSLSGPLVVGQSPFCPLGKSDLRKPDPNSLQDKKHSMHPLRPSLMAEPLVNQQALNQQRSKYVFQMPPDLKALGQHR